MPVPLRRRRRGDVSLAGASGRLHLGCGHAHRAKNQGRLLGGGGAASRSKGKNGICVTFTLVKLALVQYLPDWRIERRRRRRRRRQRQSSSQKPISRKTDFLHSAALWLLGIGTLAQAASLYALASLVIGAWTANAGGISPARWLACAALPVLLASRGLRKGTLTASGALAVAQIGFTLCMARLGLLFAFAAHLDLYKRGTSRSLLPRTYFQVWMDSSVAWGTALLFMVEVGIADDDLLDFRSAFTATWLSLTALASFTVDAPSLDEHISGVTSAMASAKRGAYVGAAYFAGAFLASAPLSPFPSTKDVDAPSQLHVVAVGALGGAIGAFTAPIVRDAAGLDFFGDVQLAPLANGVAALALPRIALALDSQASSLWNSIGRLSS